jgi:hypothetical protein
LLLLLPLLLLLHVAAVVVVVGGGRGIIVVVVVVLVVLVVVVLVLEVYFTNYVNTYFGGVNFRENPALKTFIHPAHVLRPRRVPENVGENKKERKLKLYFHKLTE